MAASPQFYSTLNISFVMSLEILLAKCLTLPNSFLNETSLAKSTAKLRFYYVALIRSISIFALKKTPLLRKMLLEKVACPKISKWIKNTRNIFQESEGRGPENLFCPPQFFRAGDATPCHAPMPDRNIRRRKQMECTIDTRGQGRGKNLVNG